MKLSQKNVEALQRGGYINIPNAEIPEAIEVVQAVIYEHKTQQPKRIVNRKIVSSEENY